MNRKDRLASFILSILKLPLITLIVVLAWIALLFDKLSEDPTFSILVIIGVLVVLFGGKVVIGNSIRITGRK